MPEFRAPVAILAALALVGALAAQYQTAPFDYYVLSLSWAPAFCALPNEASRNPRECAPGRKVGFIVHGLWPRTPIAEARNRAGRPGRCRRPWWISRCR